MITLGMQVPACSCRSQRAGFHRVLLAVSFAAPVAWIPAPVHASRRFCLQGAAIAPWPSKLTVHIACVVRGLHDVHPDLCLHERSTQAGMPWPNAVELPAIGHAAAEGPCSVARGPPFGLHACNNWMQEAICQSAEHHRHVVVMALQGSTRRCA